VKVMSRADAEEVVDALNGQYMGTRFIEVYHNKEGDGPIGSASAGVAAASSQPQASQPSASQPPAGQPPASQPPAPPVGTIAPNGAFAAQAAALHGAMFPGADMTPETVAAALAASMQVASGPCGATMDMSQSAAVPPMGPGSLPGLVAALNGAGGGRGAVAGAQAGDTGGSSFEPGAQGASNFGALQHQQWLNQAAAGFGPPPGVGAAFAAPNASGAPNEAGNAAGAGEGEDGNANAAWEALFGFLKREGAPPGAGQDAVMPLTAENLAMLGHGHGNEQGAALAGFAAPGNVQHLLGNHP